VGYNSGAKITTGNSNVTIGASAGASLTTQNNSTFIGNSSGLKSVSSYGVGLGINTLIENTSGTGNIAAGSFAGQFNTTGSYNTYVGYNAGKGRSTGTNGTMIGKYAGDFIEASNQNKSNIVAIGNTLVTCTYFKGNCYAYGGAFYANSDRRLKTDVVEVTSGIEMIRALVPVTFKYKSNTEVEHIGLIAQDVEQALNDIGLGSLVPTIVDIPDDAEETYYNMNYSGLVMPLINAVKEIDDEVKELRNEVDELKALIENFFKG